MRRSRMYATENFVRGLNDFVRVEVGRKAKKQRRVKLVRRRTR